LDKAVWTRIEPFFVPLEQERWPEPLNPTTHPQKTKGVLRKMPAAYVLLNTEIGAENQVLRALKKVEGVGEAQHLWGVYDIIANVKADDMEKLKYIVTKRIGKIGKITSKLTMIISEQYPTTLQEQVILNTNLFFNK
jgi:DNA-binding Lrp family transcriptional regulator